MIMRFVFAIALCAFPGGLHAQSLVGPTTVVDGDSLNVGSTQVRLFGIDAPEGKQTCNRDGKNWPCGEAAAGQLRSLTNGRVVQCRSQGLDAFGRTIAVCQAGGLELNRTMVASGWATAFRRFRLCMWQRRCAPRQQGLVSGIRPLSCPKTTAAWRESTMIPPNRPRRAGQLQAPARPKSWGDAPSRVTAAAVVIGSTNSQGCPITTPPGRRSFSALKLKRRQQDIDARSCVRSRFPTSNRT